MKSQGPLKKVVKAKWEGCPRVSRGQIAGSQTRWTLTLECGHVVVRYDRGGRLKAPKSARCRDCTLLVNVLRDPVQA